MTEQVFNTSTLDETNGFVIINNNATDDKLGYSVGNAGDINSDGIDDLIIGAPNANSNDRNNSGTSYIYSIWVFATTKGFASTIDISTLDRINGFTLIGATEGDLSGRSVSTVGDINGDGIDDLIIGAPNANSNGENSGAAYIIIGQK
jgi:hypothetical protein